MIFRLDTGGPPFVGFLLEIVSVPSFRSLKLGNRLLLGYAGILMLLVILAWASIDKVKGISEDLTTVNEINSVKQRYAINFRGSVHDRAILLRDVVLVDDAADLRATLDGIEQRAVAYATSARAMDAMFDGKTAVTPDEREILAGIKQTEARTLPLIAEVVRLRLAAQGEAARSLLMRDARLAFVEWLSRINTFIDLEENKNHIIGQSAQEVARDFGKLMIALCSGALLIGAAISYWSLRSVRPLRHLANIMRRLAAGDLTLEVPATKRRDEIGQMASAVLVFQNSMIQAERLTSEQEQIKLAGAEAHKAAMSKTADAFEAKIGSLVSMLSAGATELQATAQSMSSTASQTNQRASMVAASAEEASTGVQTVAAAAEELSASISEISRQVAHSSKITDQAVIDAQRTNVIVQALSEGAEKIGHVVGLISTIAGQTNLLALNATIEAARAGDAGKGFAVVASEVKSLASQTAKATQEIGAQIALIQSATKEAVDAIRAIVGTIAEVSSIAMSIAAAVEEQGAATGEIARNVQQTAQAAQDATLNIGGVSHAANSTGAAATQVLGAANGLSQQSKQLAIEVNSFIQEVRVA